MISSQRLWDLNVELCYNVLSGFLAALAALLVHCLMVTLCLVFRVSLKDFESSSLFHEVWVGVMLSMFALCLALLIPTAHNHSKRGCNQAAANGDLQSLQTCETQFGGVLDGKTLNIACSAGHQHIAEYCIQQAPQLAQTQDALLSACLLATKHGHIATMQYMLRAGCEPNAEICVIAASNGDLPCLRAARQANCHWDEAVIEKARNQQCYEYALFAGCPSPLSHQQAAIKIQGWWREQMYRPGSAYVARVVMTRLEAQRSKMSIFSFVRR